MLDTNSSTICIITICINIIIYIIKYFNNLLSQFTVIVHLHLLLIVIL